MEINEIKILNIKDCIEFVNHDYSSEIMKEFISRKGFQVDNTFDFNESVYITREINLEIEDNKCNILVYAEFLSLQKDIPTI